MTTRISAANLNTTAIVALAGAAAGQSLNGYLDDLRITRGAARYTTTFTPSSGAFRGK